MFASSSCRKNWRPPNDVCDVHLGLTRQDHVHRPHPTSPCISSFLYPTALQTNPTPISICRKKHRSNNSILITTTAIMSEFELNICCMGAGYVGGPTMAVIAAKCPKVSVVLRNVTGALFCLGNMYMFDWSVGRICIFTVGGHCESVLVFFSLQMKCIFQWNLLCNRFARSRMKMLKEAEWLRNEKNRFVIHVFEVVWFGTREIIIVKSYWKEKMAAIFWKRRRRRRDVQSSYWSDIAWWLAVHPRK